MSKIKDLRMKIKDDEIKGVLAKLGAFPYDETETAIIYPTVCHNLDGGSPKLYYYKNEKIFKCYTGCNHQFDIFDLLIKMKKLRGDSEFGVRDAIEFTGVEESNQYSKTAYEDLEYLKNLSKTGTLESYEETKLTILDKNILKLYPYNQIGVISWFNEGITQESMDKFKIGFDAVHNAITIPNFDHNGNLVGIRGRFLSPQSKAKYMPILYQNKPLSHPTSKVLYGFYENKENIKRIKTVIVFEGEKSVLKVENFLPNNNIAVATTGKKITLDHLNALLEIGVKEVILAYDKDYTTDAEAKEKFEQYDKILTILKPYFNVSIIMDYTNKLGYKDSPADKGQEVFEYLLKNRVKR